MSHFLQIRAEPLAVFSVVPGAAPGRTTACGSICEADGKPVVRGTVQSARRA